MIGWVTQKLHELAQFISPIDGREFTPAPSVEAEKDLSDFLSGGWLDDQVEAA